jgi:HD-like signal output (HDOD) protein
VLNLYIRNYFDDIFSLVQSKKMRFIDAERQVLGVDHQQLGSLIARHWRFPPQVISAIGFHHCPKQAAGDQDLAGFVYIVNRMVSAIGIGAGVDGFEQPNEDDLFVQMGVTHRMVEGALADLVEAMEKTRRFLSN